jgi:hypothetical protein
MHRVISLRLVVGVLQLRHFHGHVCRSRRSRCSPRPIWPLNGTRCVTSHSCLGYLLIIDYASSWKFGTRTGSLPNQKMTFHEKNGSSTWSLQTWRFSRGNFVVWYTGHSQSCTFVHIIILPTCHAVLFIILLLVLPYFGSGL